MKKFILLISALLTLMLCMNISPVAYAQDTAPLANAPYLEDISFSNAEIDGGFSISKTSFSLTLDDPSETPTLESYKISGNANIFLTYAYDSLNHQTGAIVTLSFESGSVIYTFTYSNAQVYKPSSNANLSDLICEYGEVQPSIHSGSTSYKLYIPSDLTELHVTPVTEDINAHCASQSWELTREQEPELSFTVTASDGSTKSYKFKVRRIDKTVSEVELEMAQPDFVSFVDGELFYQRPVFIISFCTVLGGAVVLALLSAVTKRITINPYDRDEKEFYSPIE